MTPMNSYYTCIIRIYLPMNCSILAEINLNELPESAGVVVVNCLRVAKCLERKETT